MRPGFWSEATRFWLKACGRHAVDEVCGRFSSSVSDENLAGFCSGFSTAGFPAVVALTVTDPGPGARGLFVAGLPFSVSRAPRSLRRRIFSAAT